MTKIDPIIAVKDVADSSNWYKTVFGFKREHGGDEFAVLLSESGDVALCLHKWAAHSHVTMLNPDIKPGNGLLLYLRTDHLKMIRRQVQKLNWPVVEDIHLNVNSLKEEFSLLDPDGYYWTVTSFHEYKG